jgi:hypothetical protein
MNISTHSFSFIFFFIRIPHTFRYDKADYYYYFIPILIGRAIHFLYT